MSDDHGRHTPRHALLAGTALAGDATAWTLAGAMQGPFSQVAWKNNVNGVWSNANNWTGGALPGATNDVLLSTLSARTITHNSGNDTVHSITATTDSLNVSGGTLTVLGNAVFGAGLTQGSAQLVFDGASNSVAGTFSDAGGGYNYTILSSGSTLTLNGAVFLGGNGTNAEIDGGGTLVTNATTAIYDYGNAATFGGVTWSNTGTVLVNGYIHLGDGNGATASFLNAAGGVFDLATDDAQILNTSGYGGSTFSNAGTLEKIGGAGGTSSIYDVFTNTGLINAAAGTIEFDGGGVFSGTLTGAGQIAFGGGTSTLTAGGNFNVANWLIYGSGGVVMSTALNYSGNLDLAGGGTLQLDGTSDAVTGSFYQTGSSALDLNNSSLSLSNAYFDSGYLFGPGTLTASGATTLGSGSDYYIGDGATLINNGTIQQNRQVYAAGGGFSIVNDVGSLYEMNGSNVYLDNTYNDSTFSNAGTFETSTSQNYAAFIYSYFTNTGIIDAASGTTYFESGGIFGGTLTGAGEIVLAGGASTLTAGATYSTASLLLDGGSLSLSANATPANASFEQAGGVLYLDGYTLTLGNSTLAYGSIVGTGTLLTSGTTTIANQSTLYVAGGVEWVNSGTINQDGTFYGINGYSTSFDIVNQLGATYNLTGDYQFGYTYGAALATFENAGTFALTGGASTAQVYTYFTNTGTIASNSGTLNFLNGGTFGGSLTGSGSIGFAGGYSLLTSGATFNPSQLYINGGSVEISSGVSFTTSSLYMTSGSLTMDENVTLASGVLNEQYGAIFLNAHTLTVAGANLNGYVEGGGALITNGATTLSNNYNFYMGGGANWTNTGTVTQNAYLYDDYNYANGYTINNQAGAVYNVAGDYFLGYYNGNNNTTAIFNNAGTFAKTSGTGTTTIYGAFNSTGTVSVNKGGTINFTGGGNFTGSITGTGTVDFTGPAYYTVGGIIGAANTSIGMFLGYAVTLTANTSFAGSFLMYSDTIGLGGYTLNLSGAKSFGVNGYGGEYFQGPGTLSTGGVTTVNDYYNGFTAIDVYDGATWNNTGTVSDGDRILLGDDVGSGTIVNAAGATFGLASDDAYIAQGSYVNGFGQTVALGALISNAGTFGKTGGVGTSHVYGTLVSTGTVTSVTGTLELDNGGTLSGMIADKSNVVLANGVNFSAGNLTIGGAATLTNYVTVDATGTLTLGDTTNTGKAIFANTSLYEIDGNGGIIQAGTAADVFTNTGLLEKISGTGRSVVSATISDTGTIWANSGTLALTGTVTGAGKLLIGAGATLELGANVATTQGVTFTATTGTLMLDTVSGAHGTITSFTVGDQIDLVNTSANSATLTGNTLVVFNGGTAVATLSLAGTHTGDTYSFLSDGHGGTLLGISANATSWKGTNADWNAANVWTNGTPSAQTNATVNASGKYSLSLAAGETGNASTLLLNGATATYNLNGQVNISKSLTMQAGTLNLAGVVNGGTFTEAGGLVNFISAGLENLVFQGAVNINGTNQYVELLNAVTLTGANGTGGGTVAVTGSGAVFYVDGITTLDNTTISLGSSGTAASVYSYDADGNGGVLTLGPNLILNQTGLNADLTDSGGVYDAILNSGTITANFASGDFLVSGSDFENDGKITLTNGGTFDIESASFVNTGTLTATGATFTLGGSDFLNTGTMAITNSRLNINGTHTTAQMLSLFGSGDTLGIGGTLTNTGAVLNIGAGSPLGTVALTGTIEGGTIVDTGNGLLTGEAVYGTLSDVTYDGTLNVTGGLYIAGTFNATGVGGTGAGSIVDTGNQTELVFNDTRTVDNTTITLGNAAGSYLSVNDDTGSGATLTLGAHTTLVQGGSQAYLYYYYDSTNNNRLINQGSILAGVAGGTFTALSGASGATFTNQGSIVVSGGDYFALNGAGNFTNFAGNILTGGSYEVDTGSTIELASNTYVATDAATITLSGAGSQIEALNTGTGKQITIDSKLSSIAATGVLNLLNGRNFTPVANGGAFSDAGVLNLSGVTFGGTTLTLAGGILSGNGTVTAAVADSGRITASGGTLLLSGGVSGTGLLTAIAGGTVNLVKGGALTEAISGAGTLKLDGTTPYTISAGTTASIASVLVDAGTTLFGAGTLTGAVTGAGTLTAAGGVLDLAGGGTFSGTVNGAGTLQLDGADTFALLATSALSVAQVVVDAPAILDFTAGGSLAGSIAGAGTLQLDGATPYTMAASLGIANLVIDAGAGLSGSGTITGAVVDNGSLGAASSTLTVLGAVSGAGSLFAAGGAVLDLRGGGTLTAPVSGAGTLQLDGTSPYALAGAGTDGIGTILVDAGVSLSGTGTVTGSVVNAGTIAANGGLLVLSGALSGAGSLAANAGSVLDLTLASTLAEAVSGAGTLQLDGGAFSLAGATDSVANLLIDAGASVSGFGTLAGAVVNNGGLAASGGTLVAGALSGTGSVSAAASATLDLTGGAAIGAITGAGSLQLDGSVGYTTSGTLAVGSLAVDAGASLSGSGTITGPVLDLGLITAGSGTLVLAGALTGSGALAAASATLLDLKAGGTLGNVSGGGTLQLDGTTAYGLAGGAISTAVVVSKGATLSGFGTISGAVANSGTVAASAGKLVISGAVSGTGVMQAAANAVLDLTAGGALQAISGAGTLELGAAYTTGTKAPTTSFLAIDATGSLSGTGKLTGAITDSGKLAATSGTLSLAGGLSGTGSLTASTGAVLDITKAGSNFSGAISGTGTLQIDATTTLNTGASLAISNVLENANLALGSGLSLTNAAGKVFSMNAAAGGTITLSGAGKLTNAGTLAAIGAGNANVSVGVVNSGTVNVGAGVLSFLGTVTNNGTMNDNAGALAFAKSLAGTGTLAIGAAGTLSLLAGSVATETVNFTAITGALDLASPLAFLGAIGGFGASGVGDSIDLLNTAANGLSYANNTLTVTNNGVTVANLHFNGNYTQSMFALGSDNNGGSVITFV